MDVTVCFASILIGVLSGVVLFIKHRFAYWKNRGVPYIEPKFPYGNMAGFGRSRHINDIFNEIYYKFKDQFSFSGAYFSISPTAVITDLDLVKSVLIKDFNYFIDRAFYVNEDEDPLTGNLVFIRGQKWRTMRTKLSPTFTSGKIKVMYPSVIEVTKKLVSHLNEIIEKDNHLEMKELLACYTTDIIGTCAFGIECNTLKEPNSEFRLYGAKANGELRHSAIVTAFINQCPRFGRALKMKFFPDCVIEFFCRVIPETVEYREKNNIRRNDFIDQLIAMKNEKRPDAPKLTLMELVGQVFMFFVAGFDTSSTTMAYSLFELALNQELQEKARLEIDKVLEKHNGEITYDAMMDMTYIDQIISETLRKYPIIMALTRQADRDYPVPNTDKIIEKGVGIFIPVYSIHHDPDIYPEPEVFDPDRFKPEAVQNRHPMAFLGFGDGPRNCVGARFGQMQSRVGLATLLKNYRFKLSPETKVPLEFDRKALILQSSAKMLFTVDKV